MCHVLVIEDDFFIAEHVCRLVQEAGATSIDQATTEDEAIEAARRRAPALIVSDVELAEGTGPQAVETILAERGPVPVIFVTGKPSACGDCTAPVTILEKPVRDDILVSTVKAMAPIAS